MQKNTIKLFAFIIFNIFYMVNAFAEVKHHLEIYELKKLSLEELTEVKVTLDDVFNIFDALVKPKDITIASGMQQSTARAPSITSVITAQDIEAIGATTLEEVLETIPGLHVGIRGLGYSPTYTMRGIQSSNNILLLINGTSLNTLFTGGVGSWWVGMPVKAIKRIEVIRGPGSALFGADAFTGVVNIITKEKADINGTEIGINLNSFDTQGVHLLHGDSWQDIDIAWTVEYEKTAGFEKIVEVDEQTIWDAQFGTQASHAPGYTNVQARKLDTRLSIKKDHWDFDLGFQGRSNLGTGTGVANALDPAGQLAEKRFNANLNYENNNFTRFFGIKAQLSFMNLISETDPYLQLYPSGAFGGTAPQGMLNDFDISERHTRFDITSHYSGFSHHVIRSGIGFHYGELYEIEHFVNYGVHPITGQMITPQDGMVDLTDTPLSSVPEGDRKNWHAFLQDTWQFHPRWELTTGLRYDNYSDFGSTINPRAALVWQQKEKGLTTKLLYGKAFRAPSFSDQYTRNNTLILGNPNLQPESIKNWELSLDYFVNNKLHLAWNIYSFEITDRIQYLLDEQTKITTYQNIGTWSGQGAEIEARWKLATNFSLLANYAIQHVTDDDGNTIPDTPRNATYLRTDWLFMPNWYLNTQLHRISNRERAPIDPRPQIDDYTLVHLTLRYKDINKDRWNFAIGVRNVFDNAIREPLPISGKLIGIPNDLPLAGRSYMMELRYRF